MFRNLLIAVVAIAALVCGVIFFKAWQKDKEPVQALVYPQARNLIEFQLVDHNNQPVARQDLYGQWTLAFVGYTYCPDICPLTLAKLSGVQPELAAMVKEPLKIWFISVDPDRDTPAQLARYTGYFEQPAVTGMTAGHDQLFPFVRQLGLMYAMTSSTSQDYLVDHSASVVLLNPQGQVVAMFKPVLAAGEVPVVDTDLLLQDFPKVIRRLQG